MEEQEKINRFINAVACELGGNIAEEIKNRYIWQQNEIERLNNIIEELEGFLTKVIETGAGIEQITCKNIKNYIQELKERK